ncbi:hypothetical protein DN585_00355 [Intrasporangium calvum]|nr:hypothetical protein DN585_00355 [Intrasporangium calvum]
MTTASGNVGGAAVGIGEEEDDGALTEAVAVAAEPEEAVGAVGALAGGPAVLVQAARVSSAKAPAALRTLPAQSTRPA